ncbi:MAG: PQQ-binding-like beta-propeller repeat protein [Fimbriimonadaceae bacterium]|nr:PQQ-binding-like beta-propeller repeat protein [Fimbriimonadaceae bacterium]
MKTFPYLLFLVVCLVGCGGSAPQTNPPGNRGAVYAEDDVARGPIDAHDLVVTHLEAPGSVRLTTDTGSVGADSWQITIRTTGAIGFGVVNVPGVTLRLLDAAGSQAGQAAYGSPHQRVSVKPGLYRLEVSASGSQTRMVRVGWHEGALIPGLYASAAKSPWPKFHANLQNTGLGSGKGATGKSKWTFRTAGCVDTSCAIGADGTIYAGSDQLYAIRPDGTQKWAVHTANGISSTPAIAEDGTIIVGTDDQTVLAVNPDGSTKWTANVSGDVASPAIAADGMIVVGTDANNVYAISSSGVQKWVFQTGGPISTAPAIAADGTIYVTSQDENLYALTPSGTQKWVFGTETGILSAPAIGSDGTVYFGSDSMYAINPDGSLKWLVPTSTGIESSPAIASDGTVIVGMFYSGGPNNTTVSDVVAYNPSDGSQKWSFQTGGVIESSPAIGADGTIYIGSMDNNLYAINPDGTKKWTFLREGDGNASGCPSPAIGPDGTVYIGTVTPSQTNGAFYAVD